MSWLRKAQVSNAGSDVLHRFVPLVLFVILLAYACGSGSVDNAETTQTTPTADVEVPPTTRPRATTTTTTPAITTTTSAEAICPTERPQGSEEIWNGFVAAFNDGDLAALGCMIASDIEWSWDSDLFVIHRRASGSNEAMRGLEDLIGRGITFETEIWEVEGDTLKAKTVFNEPGLAEHIGGHRLLQTDVVTVSDGCIQTWTTNANETIPSEEYLDR